MHLLPLTPGSKLKMCVKAIDVNTLTYNNSSLIFQTDWPLAIKN